MEVIKMMELKETGELTPNGKPMFELAEEIPFDNDLYESGNYILKINNYRRRAAVKQHKESWSIKQLMYLLDDQIGNLKLDLDTGGQRNYVMTPGKEKSLFQSLIMGIVPNSLTFSMNYEVSIDGKINMRMTSECIDGKQRLTAIRKIYNNQVPYIIDPDSSISIFDKETQRTISELNKVTIDDIREIDPECVNAMDNLQFHIIVYEDEGLRKQCTMFPDDLQSYDKKENEHQDMISELFVRINSGTTSLKEGELLHAQYEKTMLGKDILKMIKEDINADWDSCIFKDFHISKGKIDRYTLFYDVMYTVSLIKYLENYTQTVSNVNELSVENMEKYFKDGDRSFSIGSGNKTQAIHNFMRSAKGNILNENSTKGSKARRKLLENLKSCISILRNYSYGWRQVLNIDEKKEVCFSNLEIDKTVTYNSSIFSSSVAALYTLLYPNDIEIRKIQKGEAKRLLGESIFQVRTNNMEYSNCIHNSTATKSYIYKRMSIMMSAMFPYLVSIDPKRSIIKGSDEYNIVVNKQTRFFGDLICPYCYGLIVNGQASNVAHIKPHCNGGKTLDTNMLIAHRDCNQDAGTEPINLKKVINDIHKSGKLLGIDGKRVVEGKLELDELYDVTMNSEIE